MLLSTAAAAHQQRTAAPDSVRGQGQLVKQLVADACQRLGNQTGRAAPDLLSPAQAYEQLDSALSAATKSHAAGIRKLANRTKAAGAYNQLRADLPGAAAQRLTKQCPVAAALYGRFSRFLGDYPTPTPAEKQFVRAWGDELCQRFAVLDQEDRFQGKTGEERMALFDQEYSAAFAAREPKIAQLYGGAIDEKQGITQKFVLMLANELGAQLKGECPQLLRLFGGAR